MKNTLEAAYQQELKIRADYDAAEAAGREDGKEAARTSIHELWDEIEAKGASCSRIYREYKNSRDRGNKDLDLHDVIWDKDVPDMIACMRENGIKRFTFSSGWSSAVETAWLFQENGCWLEALILINGDEDFWHKGQYERIPAYVFSIR